jgi:hypothetical protein
MAQVTTATIVLAILGMNDNNKEMIDTVIRKKTSFGDNVSFPFKKSISLAHLPGILQYLKWTPETITIAMTQLYQPQPQQLVESVESVESDESADLKRSRESIFDDPRFKETIIECIDSYMSKRFKKNE